MTDHNNFVVLVRAVLHVRMFSSVFFSSNSLLTIHKKITYIIILYMIDNIYFKKFNVNVGSCTIIKISLKQAYFTNSLFIQYYYFVSNLGKKGTETSIKQMYSTTEESRSRTRADMLCCSMHQPRKEDYKSLLELMY